MTPQTVTTHRRSLDRAEGWLELEPPSGPSRPPALRSDRVAYFGVHVVPHLGRVCVCQPGATDPASYMWNLAWWPHALLNGLNPFWTNAVFVPNQVDLGSAPSFIPGAAILATPLTLLFGPIVTYNVLMLMSPVLAAFFAFLLCRYVSGSFPASVVGGYLFGFSTYMVGQLQGHLHLVLVFPIPAAVHLTLRLIDRRISQRRFIALMALAIAALLSFSTEVLFDICFARCGRPWRRLHTRARRPRPPSRRSQVDSRSRKSAGSAGWDASHHPRPQRNRHPGFSITVT